ncbi:MAG: ATP-binding protein [Bacteroidota bacterium]
MFRRYPYWGWLALGLVLWCATAYHFRAQRRQLLPAHMAELVNKDLHNREDALMSFLQQRDIIDHIFDDSLSEKELAKTVGQQFFIYGYQRDELIFWSTNTIVPDPCDSTGNKWHVLRTDKGVFLQKCLSIQSADSGRQLVILLPVTINYPIANEYLQSHFAASDDIPVKTAIELSDSAASWKYPIITSSGETVFYLHFLSTDIQKWVPDALLVLLLVGALLVCLSWLHLMIIHLTGNRSSMAGFLMTLGVIVTLRVLLYSYGLPLNLGSLLFFSPQLYASSKYLSSFGDLFINTLCFLWLVMFITRHTPYKTYFSRVTNGPLKWVLAIVLTVLQVAYLFFLVNLIRSLVLDSNISFDVSHFYTINIYTVFGLLVVGTLIGISCMVIYLFNTQLQVLVSSRILRYLLVATVGALYLLLAHRQHQVLPWLMILWLLLFIIMLDIPKLTLVSDLFEPQMISWGIFIAAFSSGLLQYFNEQKEQVTRAAFVMQNLSSQRDNEMEYAFDKAAAKVERDAALKTFLSDPSPAARRHINQRFDTMYFSGPVDKYQASLYFYDDIGTPLYNKDTTDILTWHKLRDESITTNSPNLFYKESILGDHHYLAIISIYSDTINARIGYAVINLDKKKQPREAVYPELLKPAASKNNGSDKANYPYAVYIKGKLLSQVGDYPFTTRLDDTLQEGETQFRSTRNGSELYSKVSDRRTVVAARNYARPTELITLFSYVFVVQLLLAIVILLYQLYLSYFTKEKWSGTFLRLTLSKRVHFAMLAVVGSSFIAICIVTVWSSEKSFKKSNDEKLQGVMQLARESVQNYLKTEGAYQSPYAFDSVIRSTNFKSTLAVLAGRRRADINVFNDEGYLGATSQDDIYEKGLISPIMRPEAFHKLHEEEQSKVIQQETVGELTYISAYEPLRDEQGQTLGYVNVPFFSSVKDLNNQISEVIVALINLYAFIFLVASIASLFVTKWITNSFNLIIQQFNRLNLQRNERISWKYDDEIGLLVKEYNKMVNKVEENAALLAQSERETAWREMARQVAHEIKNPLTPMKLNIQYLQQAARNDNPNIKQLTNKVAESIIEQIDNLSYIASEFSNFAKMPEAKPEELELGELVNKAVELYLNEDQVKVTINKPAEMLYVYSDRSQLLRVCNNLLENARHAIEEKQNGLVEVILKTDGKDALLAIRDNGNGIPHDVAKKIFQPYFTTKTSGTGLGLAMTRKIIEFWKGTIWFDTEEGSGTTFFIKLPLVVPGASHAAVAEQTQ